MMTESGFKELLEEEVGTDKEELGGEILEACGLRDEKGILWLW